MAELELTRTPGDRKVYVLDGVGMLRVRVRGRGRQAAVAEAGGRCWTFARRGLFAPLVTATDETGTVVGVYRSRMRRPGGQLGWAERELRLRRSSTFRQHYTLSEGEQELALFHGTGRARGKSPISLTIDDPTTLDPGLVLFAAYIVRGIVEDLNRVAVVSG
jgi:hypothetical protein